MASSTHTIASTTTSALDMASPDSTVFRGKGAQRNNGNSAPRRRRDTKYRHVFATHSEKRESCLSPGSGDTPSFVGFRNLMILVLSAHSPPPATC